MTAQRHTWLVALGLWLVLLAAALLSRALLPIDETRYVAVAWEMWQRGDFLVPHLNGAPYSDKPPLLFWVMHAGWGLFGVSELWARLVPPLFGLACLFLTRRLARVLWPDRDDIAGLAPLIVIGSLLWALFNDVVLFEMLLGFCVLVGIVGLLDAWQHGGVRGWLLLGAGIGLGILAKGPVTLLYILPVAVLAPWWARGSRRLRWSRWYPRLGLATGLGAAVALAWAIPAAQAGGPAYGDAILFHQSVDRMVASAADQRTIHQRPFWWYVPLLPAILFPWLVTPAVWRALGSLRKGAGDDGVRFCIAWLIPAFVAFSLISGKQLHYLLPLFPGFALLTARALGGPLAVVRRRDMVVPALILVLIGTILLAVPPLAPDGTLPEWATRISPIAGLVLLAGAAALLLVRFRTPAAAAAGFAAATALLVMTVEVSIMQVAGPWYDTRPVAAYLSRLERQDHRIAHVGKYHGQYHFAGRLERPFDVIEPADVTDWLAQHPDGVIVARESDTAADADYADQFVHPYRSGFVIVTVGG